MADRPEPLETAALPSGESTVIPEVEASMWKDTDAIISRLDVNIEKERKTIDDLLARIFNKAS